MQQRKNKKEKINMRSAWKMENERAKKDRITGCQDDRMTECQNAT